jgi:hypothetical protein
VIEDRGDAIRVGDDRFQLGGQDLLGTARIARGAANLPSGADQALAQLLAPASAADDQRPRQAPLPLVDRVHRRRLDAELIL